MSGQAVLYAPSLCHRTGVVSSLGARPSPVQRHLQSRAASGPASAFLGCRFTPRPESALGFRGPAGGLGCEYSPGFGGVLLTHPPILKGPQPPTGCQHVQRWECSPQHRAVPKPGGASWRSLPCSCRSGDTHGAGGSETCGQALLGANTASHGAPHSSRKVPFLSAP